MFHKVLTNISAENLTGIFTDGKLLHTTMRSICILDGDHSSDITNFIVALPGKAAPEAVLLNYAEKLYDADDSFWRDRTMVDDGKIAFNPAVELSYLDSYQQRAVLDAMALNDCTPSHAQSIRLKKLAQEGLLDDQIVYAVLAETKPNQQEQLKFKREELRKYFPSGYTEEQMRRDIIKGLELLKRQRERNRDAR